MTKYTELWIDALEFNEKGGWKEDTQFVRLMGSSYLMAADDAGVPVADATTKVTVPETANYRIWVRDRNWLRHHSPGKFKLVVDGESTFNTLGAMPSDSWIWEIAGDFQLEAGEHTLALHDLTGYFGRCASILLTTDLDYVPPREVDRLQRERARIKGLPASIAEGGEYDLIVVGGGPGGVPAAVAAARLGTKVLLIHDRPILGGNASGEIGVPSYGAEVGHHQAREGGIAEEIMRLRDRETEKVGEWTRPMEQLVAAEKNITLLRNANVCDVEMDGNTIKSVVVQDYKSLCKTRYSAKLFSDCTGDAWLGYYAGAKFRYGREARYEHGESIAPEFADTITMSGCVRSGNVPYFIDTGAETTYTLPEWCPKLPEDEENFGRVIMGPRVHWWMEAPNTFDDIYDGEETRDALLMVTMGSWDHMKNHWAKKDTVKNYKLNIAGIVNGKRESRRLIGDHILTQNDCIEARKFEDTVAYSGWALDIHHPEGIYSGKAGPLYSGMNVPIVNVPYRCLYSQNIDNLFMAGRNVSATHIAIGTLRVQLTIMTMGQAVGTAAHLCLKHGVNPRGIYENHIRELQQLLIKHDQYIPGFQNEDEGDPCLGAKVSASSVSSTELYHKGFGVEGKLVALDKARSTVQGLNTKRGNLIENVYLKLYNSTSEPMTVTAYVCTEGDLDTAAQSGKPFSAQAVVPPQQETWVEFNVNLEVERGHTGEYMRTWLEPTEGLYWRSIEKLSFYRQIAERTEDGKWETKAGSAYSVMLKQPVDIPADCSPENVINGHSRILSKDLYEWVSDPAQQLPQWLELELAKPTDINWISLVFDTDMTNPSTCRDFKFPYVPTCVKDYFVEVFADGKWVKVADVADNFMRKCSHSFETVKAEKIRVTVTKVADDPSARIIEVRAALDA